MKPRERVIRDRSGRAFRTRVRAYVDLGEQVDAAVLVSIDIDAIRRHDAAMPSAATHDRCTRCFVVGLTPLQDPAEAHA